MGRYATVNKMIKHIMIAGLLVLMLSGVGTSATNIMTGTEYVIGGVGSPTSTTGISYLNNTDNLVGNISVQGEYYYKAYKRYITTTAIFAIKILPTVDVVLEHSDIRYAGDPYGIESRGTGFLTRSLDSDMQVKLRVSIVNAPDGAPAYGYVKAYAIFTTNPIYHMSGTTDCLSNVSLYYNNSGSWIYMLSDNLTEDDYYKFNVTTGIEFKLIFDNDHEYLFEITDDNKVYNYDECPYTKYRFEESCGHLIPDSEGYYCEDWTGGGGICYTFHEQDGILNIANTSLDGVTIYSNTFIGQKWWNFNNPIDYHTYNCINTAIDWGLKVIVQNASDGTLINDAMVRVNQSCYCTHSGCVINPDQSCTCGGTSVRQKKTVNGMVSFGEMSLQDASLFVMASGYKILDEDSTGYSAFLSGRTNFSSKTWVVKLAPNGDANESDWFEPQNKVDIHFRNVNDNRTSKILDIDANVYLYYENNNSENEAMTLKFQSSSTHTYFSDEQSWTIAHDDIGHKTIANSYFTPWNYAYRAVIYNSSIYGWNLTIPLTVRNGTKEEDQHYENLTTNLWFMHEADGKIDYREDMEIVSHAGSNNTTLMNIDLEIWKDGTLLCYKNLTAADYVGADFPYYYVYEPIYNYVSGSNYTAKMYGFDRTLLEVRYLECVTDNTTRKNRLIIGVKDRSGTNLDNCYIYLEDWGSLPTGSTYYNSYEGIDNGYYRYKALKSGYSGTGWAGVTLSNDDEIVWYTLTEDHTNTSATQQKLTDDDIKGIFFPLMFFLLICIVFGGFKYVSS